MKTFGNGLDNDAHVIGDAVFDPSARTLSLAGRRHRLEPKAAAVLAALAAREGQVVARETLLDACWEEGGGSDEALTQAVAQLRRALGDDPRQPRYLETIPRTGYRLMPKAGPELARAAPARRRQLTIPWMIAAAAAAVLITLILAPPHGLRHALRHGAAHAAFAQAR
jgi:DNA-binding winged helix-turn-helix (wHTH) protein